MNTPMLISGPGVVSPSASASTICGSVSRGLQRALAEQRKRVRAAEGHDAHLQEEQRHVPEPLERRGRRLRRAGGCDQREQCHAPDTADPPAKERHRPAPEEQRHEAHVQEHRRAERQHREHPLEPGPERRLAQTQHRRGEQRQGNRTEPGQHAEELGAWRAGRRSRRAPRA